MMMCFLYDDTNKDIITSQLGDNCREMFCSIHPGWEWSRVQLTILTRISLQFGHPKLDLKVEGGERSHLSSQD